MPDNAKLPWFTISGSDQTPGSSMAADVNNTSLTRTKAARKLSSPRDVTTSGDPSSNPLNGR